uniref:protein kintoun n=1 Tax=Euleptes europaea TaxID=460621 RepID=UPI00254150CA|nr:protein kintoun [Euleptes europaea]
MAGRSSLEELELTGEEAERLRLAFQDEGFRRLFAEYAAELSDPAQRAVYEAEVAALERQRGVEARFLHPTPGWVLRTSQAGARRCYLNVCSNALVAPPRAAREPGGSRWALPHCLAPGREELARGGRRRLVYDVLFHPDALRLAARSARFRRLVDETALEAVERHFSPGLDRANAAPLRGAKYKGVPTASLLRTPLPEGAAPPPPDGGGGAEGGSPLPAFPTPYAYPPPQPAAAAADPQPEPGPAAAAAAPTTPRWTLRQRSYVDLQDYRCSRDSAPGPVPRELEVAVELPLLRSAAQAQLEVRGRELQLDSRAPAAAYRLRLPLPYPVDEGRGRAVFDKSKRRLVVTLPVRPRPGYAGGQGEEAPPEEEEQEPPGSGSSPLHLETPAGSCAHPPNHRPGGQPLPLAHVGANHVELPARAGESGPAAVGASGGAGESPGASAACPAPLDAHVGPAPEPPGDPEARDRVAPGAANCRLEAQACDGSAGSSAAEGAPCDSDDKGHASGPAPLDPEVCVGVTVCCGITSPPPVSEVGLGTDMDLTKCPKVTGTVPSSGLGDATVPSMHLCGVGSSGPVTTECHSLSNPDHGGETCTGTDVSWYPGSNPEASVLSSAAPSADLSVTTVSPTNGPPGSLLLSRTGLVVAPETTLSSPDSPEPPSDPTPPLCPPFQCTQDEEALMLLLPVPDIVPQSLKGKVGTNHYRVSFASKDSVSYTLLLQLPPENKLTYPETGISVSLNNTVIHLTKAPETAGLWTKLYFGLNEDALQEKLFVTEDNVAGFLDSLQIPSCASQPETERQPLIEVLNVSEGNSRFRLKAQEHNSPEAGKTEEKVNPRTEDGEHPFSAEKHPLITDPAGEHTMQTKKAFNSLTAAETKEPAGWGQSHCLEPGPADSGSATPGKSQIMKFQESELAFTTELRATSTEQMRADGGEHAGTREDTCSDSCKSSSPAAPVLRETDMRDGSVQIISHHTTHCAVSFQNPLLYELD